MELIRGQHNIRARHFGCVATIGNFDGVHLGHRAIIDQLIRIGQKASLPTVLITFEPKPREFFAGQNAPARLTRFREKVEILLGTPLDRVLCLRFNRELAHLSPREFVETLLVGRLGIKHLIVGDDFRFGRNAQGDIAYLREAGARHDFQVAQHATFHVDGIRVSSSWIRTTLAAGDMDLAAKLLGRSYSMDGRVIQGDQIGRTLGFATANIRLRRLVSPLAGVYAVLVHGITDQPCPGVANVGTRPTVSGSLNQLEVHILDFMGDIYGRHVRVDFLHHLRSERRFGSMDELRNQIQRDIQAARGRFADLSPPRALNSQ
jgi:riboflavin kinase/FMN adenylyltransferase